MTSMASLSPPEPWTGKVQKCNREVCVLNNAMTRCYVLKQSRAMQETAGITMTAFRDFSALAIKHLDNMSAVGKAATEGFQAITGEAIDYSNKTFENGRVFVAKICQAKSPNDFGELQSRFAQRSYELLVAKTMNVNELYADLVNEALWRLATDASELPDAANRAADAKEGVSQTIE